jgi:glyoxylase-like metal-dependent hydrolase (beta-lactamase superfamily II)
MPYHLNRTNTNSFYLPIPIYKKKKEVIMKITNEVYALDSTRGNYAYVILAPTVILIDTGHPGQGQKILDELGSLNVAPNDVRHIFLTHHDVDHIGNAAFLQGKTDAKIWASQIDIAYITGKTPRTGIKRLAAWLMPAKIPTQISAFPPENELEGIKIISTPGHTPGHVCFLYKDVLFAGDLVIGSKSKLQLSSAIMTWDMAQVKESAQKVARLPFHWVCPAHGAWTERGKLWEQL